MSRRAERRGSFQQYTPSQWYKETLKGSILHRIGVEGQSTVIQVHHNCMAFVIVGSSFLHG